MCKFYHFRHFIGLDGINGELDVKGGKTVAFEVEGDFIRFAVANCSPKDNFCRRTGRLISEGRLKSGRHQVVKLLANQSTFEAILEAL